MSSMNTTLQDDIKSGEYSEPAKLEQRKRRGLPNFGRLRLRGQGATTEAQVNPSGGVDVDIHHENGLTRILTEALEQQERAIASERVLPADLESFKNIPKLNVVIQIVGSRGDVQPFVALGKVLMEAPYGHRVRLCTHPAFKDFVEENGLEFFSIGGDPEQLMAYMVKNPGLVPGLDSIKAGDIGKRRKGVQESLERAWQSCVDFAHDEPGEKRPKAGRPTTKPFIADAIIANPPSFAHLHIAEKLSIPLHLMFTMPWSPTQAFPHPLANIKATNVDKPIANFLSYPLMELMTWQGLGDIINDFRIKTLKLDPIQAIWAGGLISRLEVPYTYAWSTALIPKPRDWGSYISISGFYFLGLASKYKPPQDLADFLAAGDKPIYIGFGSIVIDNPDKTTELIFEAVKRTGVRCLLSKGWSKLGGDSPPENVFLLDNCPHDWLFPRVACVVHHGGAGTTAIGVALGKPTVVVPFFGDQPFWGAMINRAGAGPVPVPFRAMTADSLTDSITFALKPETLEQAKRLAAQIQNENGQEEGAKSFHRFLPLDKMRCMLDPTRLAVFHIKRLHLRVSAFAAVVLQKAGVVRFQDLQRIKYKEWNLEEGPRGPLGAGIISIVGTLTDIMLGIGTLSKQIVQTTSTELHQPHSFPGHRGSKGLIDLDREENDTIDRAVMPPISKNSTVTASRLHAMPEADLARNEEGRDADSQTKDLPLDRTTTSMTRSSAKTPGARRWHRAYDHHTMHLYSRRNISSAFPGFLYHGGDINSSVYLEKRRRARLAWEAENEQGPYSLRKEMGQIMLTSGMLASKVVTWPIDFMYDVASGFHNAPVLLCGDDTVRRHIKIVGVSSGLYAAGRELTLGFYDGTTGLVMQPYHGAKKDGGKGFLKGIGKGIGGFVFKTQAGLWAIPGYSFKGLEKEIMNLRSSEVYDHIKFTRNDQGLKEFEESTPAEREAVMQAWKEYSAPAKRR